MKTRVSLLLLAGLVSAPVFADENLLGYTRGAEPLPEDAAEFHQYLTHRTDKGVGHYSAWNTETEYEVGITDRFSVKAGLLGQSIDAQGIRVGGYFPADIESGLRFSGAEVGLKYNFLSPARDDFGLSFYSSLDYLQIDPHSGQDKTKIDVDMLLLLQKYFLEGQLIWTGNVGMETTWAKRGPIADLPEDLEWPTEPEMEVELTAATGLSYRFASNWFIGAEGLYQEENETEVGKERYSFFAGPSLHYGDAAWWGTLTYMQQIRGGGEKIEGQDDLRLYLIERTKYETRLKFGYNF